jgi:hypothetical protein
MRHRGKEMDFIRSLLLVLCISVCGVGVVSAEVSPNGSQAGPARAASSRNAPVVSNVHTQVRKLTNSAGTTPTYWGPPYVGDYIEVSAGSIEGAVSAIWADYQRQYAYAFPGCTYSEEFIDPNNPYSPGHVDFLPLMGTCGGNLDVYATGYPYAPAKNTGPPCSCAGDPINLGTGNEYRDDEDAALGALGFHRYYNSHASVASTAAWNI